MSARRAAILAALAGLLGCGRGDAPDLGRVRAVESRLTLAADDGGSGAQPQSGESPRGPSAGIDSRREPPDGGTLAVVDRQGSPELHYRVTLGDVPLGAPLQLECAWRDPAGQVVHANRYATRTIDKIPWPTHCRHRVGPAAAPGRWSVEMGIGGRRLASTSFEVR